jgi:hypothetical protein
MNSPQSAPGSLAQGPTVQGSTAQGSTEPGRSWTRRLVNVLVALVVIAVAGATFVFSYSGVHAIALLGGVSTQLARYYPGLFDAVLVIACVAAVILRDGRWWARLWAWVVLVIVLGAIGTADVLHAMNYTLRHRPTEGIVAAAPVAAVLLAFSLLLTLLRQPKAQAPSAAAVTTRDVPALPAAVPTLPIALPAAPAVPRSTAATDPTISLPVPATSLPVPATAAEAAPPTQPSEVISAGAPTVAAAAGPDEPAPPTVAVPAVTLSPVPRSQGIRYAGGARNAPPSPDYWETDDTEQFGGLVYRVRDEAPDDVNDADDDTEDDDNDTGNAGDDTGSEDVPADEPANRPDQPEFDDDAPPFATAPCASVPHLNRVRSMPTPPADEDE